MEFNEILDELAKKECDFGSIAYAIHYGTHLSNDKLARIADLCNTRILVNEGKMDEKEAMGIYWKAITKN